MRITPLDVRKQEFRKAVRGFDGDEVNAFLATVADEYETVLRDNKELRERILELEDKVSEYRSMEKTLRDTLMTAERVMTESKDNAQREADLILKDAELRAQQVLDSFRSQAEELRREIIDLHKEKETYLARFRSLAEALIQFIDNHHSDFDNVDQRMMNMADTATQTRVVRSAPSASTTPAYSPPPVPQSTVPFTERPTQPTVEVSPTSGREVDEWRDYDPDVGSRGKSRRHLDTAATAAAAIAPNTNSTPAQPASDASYDEAVNRLATDTADQQDHRVDQIHRDHPEDHPEDHQDDHPSDYSNDHSHHSGHPERQDHPEQPNLAENREQQTSTADQDNHQRPDQRDPDPYHQDSSDNDVERQTDEVVEMLSPMEEDPAPSSEGYQKSVDTAERQDSETDPEDEAEKEPVRTWDMDSFTRGLGDM